MEKRYFSSLILFVAFICVCSGVKQPNYVCPSPTGTIVSDSIKVSLDGDIALSDQDSYCYSLTLPRKFGKQPNVAVALNKFHAKETKNLYLSIKPLTIGTKNNDISVSLTTITFSVNLYQQYTKWTLVEFYFLAQDRSDVEAGYKLIDGAALSRCESGKTTSVYLPFNNQLVGHIEAFTFLHGFELSSKTSLKSEKHSPLEVQILNKRANSTGVFITLSVTSTTQVYSLLISFVVFQSNFGKVYGGFYKFENYEQLPSEQIRSISHSPQVYIDQMWARIYGLSGLVVNSNSIEFGFDSGDFKSIFNFKINNFWNYFSYEYVFFLGGLCSDCEGYPIFHLGQCLNQCPSQTVFNGYTCIQCSKSQIWNGTHCISRCTAGKVWINETCVCPVNHQWNGYNCAPCTGGKSWDEKTRVCSCPSNTVWNGFNCIACDGGRVFDAVSRTCVCIEGTLWNGDSCVTVCPPDQVWNGAISQCQCAADLFWDGSHCIKCSGGRYYNSNTRQCQCQNGYWNGYVCGTNCMNGMVWNSQLYTCQCPKRTYSYNGGCIACGSLDGDLGRIQCRCPTPSTFWNGYDCVLCDKQRIFDPYMGTCTCPDSKKWNGTDCVGKLCPTGFEQIGKQCFCPQNTYEMNGQCVPFKNCTNGMIWNHKNNRCQKITCQPGTFWDGEKCMTSHTNENSACPFGTYWNGFFCSSYAEVCPQGTQWTGAYCQTVQKKCQPGTYWTGSLCAMISCQCPNQLLWSDSQNRCVPTNNNCPSGAYYNGYTCMPYNQCKNNQIWSNSLAQCVCPQNSFWNGNTCINCPGGMIYSRTGCSCPVGMFFDGSTCSKILVTDCSKIPYSFVNGSNCDCIQGFDKVDGACVCNGVLIGNNQCDKCTQKPNSKWTGFICQCLDGFVQVFGKCKPKNQTSNPNGNQLEKQTNFCSVGTYFDIYEQKCLLCSDGCLSCKNCYDCQQCRPQYTYFAPSKSCVQICGDGKRFSLQCDDGNNIDGDGCSADCRTEIGFTCNGGSPNSKDTCSKYKPEKIQLIQTGQTHLYGKIILNVMLNYLPTNLTTNANLCNQVCDRVLLVKLVDGQKSFLSINSQYIKGSSYSFSIEIDFGREPISQFTAQISINNQLKEKFFSGIDISSILHSKVNPAYLSILNPKNQDKI